MLSFPDAEGQLNEVVGSLQELTCKFSVLLLTFEDVSSNSKLRVEWMVRGKEGAEGLSRNLGSLVQALSIVLSFAQM